MKFTIYDLRFVIAVVVLVAGLAAAPAGDLTKGYTFSSGEQNVTHTKLNNLVDNATINASFYTDKSAITVPSDSDLALIYSTAASGLRKITLGNLLYGNSFLITNLPPDATPAADDYVMTYDVNESALKKATLRATIFESANLIANRTNWPTPGRISTSLLAYDADSGAWSNLTRSNLFYQFYEFNPFTNLLAHTSPTNDDRLLFWDSVNGTNKTTTLSGLITNSPATTWTNSADVLWTYSVESNRVGKLPLSSVLGYINASQSRQIQSVAASTATMSTIAAATPGGTIPIDDTIPQNNEGTELLTQAITPTDANNIIEIEASVPVAIAAGANGSIAAAFFQDSTANAIAAMSVEFNASLKHHITFRHRMTAGTTSATTFKLRVGTTTGTLTINGSAGTRQFGGVSRAWLVVREIKP